MQIELPGEYAGEDILYMLKQAAEDQTTEKIVWCADRFPAGLKYRYNKQGIVETRTLSTLRIFPLFTDLPLKWRWWQGARHEFEGIELWLSPLDLSEPYGEVALEFSDLPAVSEHKLVGTNIGNFIERVVASFYDNLASHARTLAA